MSISFATHRHKRLLLGCMLASLTVIASCSGDDSGDEPNAGEGGATGGHGGASGATGGHSGAAGSSGGTGGNGGAGTSGGAGGSGGAGASGGSGGSGGSTDQDAGEVDSGTDSGVPDDTFACVAPVPSTDFGEDCPGDDPVPLKLTTIRDDLAFPIFVTHAPDDESRLFVVLRGGQILILDPESGETQGTFLDLDPDVVAANDGGGEYGLLGLAFHPNYPEDPRIFVNYIADPEDNANFGETRISSFEVSDDPNVVDASTEQILLHYGQPQSNHNGGMLAFGTDNCLYSAAGDGGQGNDEGAGHSPGGNGQDLSKPLGKILRLDPDHPDDSAPGNLEGASFPHIWDYGMRNPWRFSFDRTTGDMYIGDVGQGALEEVDVAPRGVGNHNYGWPIMEGLSCRGGGGGCDMDGLDLPIHDYDHITNPVVENCIIGGYVYRGANIPSLNGWYLYGDSGEGHSIHALVWDGDGTCDTPLWLSDRDDLTVNARITSFGEDAAGELYVTSAAGLYRFDEGD